MKSYQPLLSRSIGNSTSLIISAILSRFSERTIARNCSTGTERSSGLVQFCGENGTWTILDFCWNLVTIFQSWVIKTVVSFIISLGQLCRFLERNGFSDSKYWYEYIFSQSEHRGYLQLNLLSSCCWEPIRAQLGHLRWEACSHVTCLSELFIQRFSSPSLRWRAFLIPQKDERTLSGCFLYPREHSIYRLCT